MSATALLTAAPTVSAAIGVTVTPEPPKEAVVQWDETGLSVDYVLVGVKAASAPPDQYLNKTIGVPGNDNDEGEPSSTRLTDLNVATSYNFRVQVFLVGGGVQEEIVRTQGYRLSLKTERDVVLRGRSLAVEGVLQSSGPKGSPVVGGLVRIQANAYPFDDNNWTTVDTASTANNGSYRGTVSPGSNTRYRAIYAGDGIGSWTSTELVGVRVKVSIAANPNPVDFGRAAVFSGSLKAPDAKVNNVPVILQRKISGTWTGVAQGQVNANGNYSLSFESLNRNDSYYRVVTSGGVHFSTSTSKRIQLVVR
jgi:hypothetical protein